MAPAESNWLVWKEVKAIMGQYGIFCSKVHVRHTAEKYGFCRSQGEPPLINYERGGLEEWLSAISGKGELIRLAELLKQLPNLKRKNPYAVRLILQNMGITVQKKYGRLFITKLEGEKVREKYR